VGCQAASSLQGRIDGLRDIIEQAERNGAYNCAPRALAEARAYTDFANEELERGNLADAQNHYVIAEPNARAALRMSGRTQR